MFRLLSVISRGPLIATTGLLAVNFHNVSANSPAQPAFSCTKANSADERTICSDTILARIDELINSSYVNYKPHWISKEQVGRLFQEDRHRCGPDKVCITLVQSNTLSEYGANVAWVDLPALSQLKTRAARLASFPTVLKSRLPTKIGECVRTRIAYMSDRFGHTIVYDDRSAGIRLMYDNDVFLVDYERTKALDNAELGDPIIVCLSSIPHDCPLGDNRGREYYSFDLLTGEDWFMIDSQHSCGGA